MPVPATTGQLRTRIEDMQIGDYIACNYQASSGAVGTFSNFGGTASTEIPIGGSATPNGTFYFVKVAKGLLVADRVVQHTISWNTLNAGKFIEGKTMTLGTTNGILRSLTGGVAYADANGNKSLTDLGIIGTFPSNNEFDKYIINFPTNLIQTGKTTDDIFHWSGCNTWCQETPVNGVIDRSVTANNTYRVGRGTDKTTDSTKLGHLWLGSSNLANTYVGFRPVFEFVES